MIETCTEPHSADQRAEHGVSSLDIVFFFFLWKMMQLHFATSSSRVQRGRSRLRGSFYTTEVFELIYWSSHEKLESLDQSVKSVHHKPNRFETRNFILFYSSLVFYRRQDSWIH